MEISRFDVILVSLDPTQGSEIKKTRPCLVISPDELNHNLRTLIVAPLTTAARTYPTRITCNFQGKSGQVVLDQIRTIDRGRVQKKLGNLELKARKKVLSVLAALFAE